MTSAPTWDLGSYFPVFGGPAYQAHWETLRRELDDLAARADGLGDIQSSNLDEWVELFLLDERIGAEMSHLASYVGCLAAADAANEDYQRAEAELSGLYAKYSKAFAPILDALRRVGDADFQALAGREELADAVYFLGRLRQKADWTMETELEKLAADLNVDGMGAWGRLYNTMSGRLTFTLDRPGGEAEKVPMARKRALLEDPDPGVRSAALHGSNEAWREVEYVASAGLNAIAGTRLSLYRRRGVPHFLDMAMFESAVRRETVEQMWRVVAERREATAWRYLRAKARALGMERLGFQDLSCPLATAEPRRIGWGEAVSMILDAFQAGYPALADFCRLMLDKRRVEAEPRPGKRPGAFCTTSLLTRESRVFMTFDGALGDVQTLAHELGHAFHGFTLREKRPMAARYPMTLAETASTFAERLFQDSLLDVEGLDRATRLQVLTSRCNHAATFMCDIHMRYLFETAFYTERETGEVATSRIKELMLQAQRETYGDTLDPDELDPMFWASKLHFYITGVSFYNFPYTFGFLFSLGLCGMLRDQGQAFLPRYEELLRLTGSDTAENVAWRALGVDLTGPDFWHRALDAVERDVVDFEELT